MTDSMRDSGADDGIVYPAPIIRVSKYTGIAKVTFAVEMGFDLASGKAEEWQRLRVASLE